MTRTNTNTANSATVQSEPLNKTADLQVVDPATHAEPQAIDAMAEVGDILESALPTALSSSEIAHIRALNTQGESVNTTPEQVKTLVGMDYSRLDEQIVHGEYWLGTDGKKKQVYVRTFKGTTPKLDSSFYGLLLTLLPDSYVDKAEVCTGSTIGGVGSGWFANSNNKKFNNSTWWCIAYKAQVNATPYSPEWGEGSVYTERPYQITLKYTKA